MSIISRVRGRGAATPTGGLDGWVRDADAISLPRLDEVGGHPRPAGVGTSYAEQEYHALADQQELSWPAQGERSARPFQVRARGLDRPAAATDFLLTENETEVRQARADYHHAATVLTPYVRREPKTKLRYWIVWPLLAIGDASGVLSAAITLGDIPWVAAGQALSSGLAAACAGLFGTELKHRQLAQARRRDPDTLTDEERRYQRLFTGGEAGFGVVKLVGLLSLTVVFLLAVAVGALRTSVEGNASGLTFGLLAAATAIGSGLLGYSAADEVADLLATYRKRVAHAEKRHLALSGIKPARRQAEAEETARSIQAEHQLDGQAAGKRLESLSWRVQRRNPQVFGHGFSTGEQSGVIGRRIRRGGAA